MLIPAYFLLWLWGEGERPLCAAVKFVLYTLAGSLLMLVGDHRRVLFHRGGVLRPADLATPGVARRSSSASSSSSPSPSRSRSPLFPFHGWLRDAYLAAPDPDADHLRRA